MTDGEALEKSRKLAAREGWPWHEPVRVITSRRGLAGRVVHVVITTPDARRKRVRFELDARTGAVLSAEIEKT
jgi:hypothetical protein